MMTFAGYVLLLLDYAFFLCKCSIATRCLKTVLSIFYIKEKFVIFPAYKYDLSLPIVISSHLVLLSKFV